MDLHAFLATFKRKGRPVDWITILCLFVFAGLVSLAYPFERDITPEKMAALYKNSMHPDTVPNAAVLFIGGVGPSVLFAGLAYTKALELDDLQNSLVGLWGSLSLTTALTQVAKVVVGRPRPDFYYRCFPDGNELWLSPRTPDCSRGNPSLVKDGRQSFFSGHSSLTSAGLTFTTFMLLHVLKLYVRDSANGNMRGFGGGGLGNGAGLPLPLSSSPQGLPRMLQVLMASPLLTLTICICPTLGACLVGASRVNDNRHHPSDVAVGLAVGLLVSFLSFRLFFPSFWSHGSDSYKTLMPLSPSRRDIALAIGGEMGASGEGSSTPARGAARARAFSQSQSDRDLEAGGVGPLLQSSSNQGMGGSDRGG